MSPSTNNYMYNTQTSLNPKATLQYNNEDDR